MRRGEGRKREGNVPKGRVAKMSGLYRGESLGEGQPSPWAGECSIEGGEHQPSPVTAGRTWRPGLLEYVK